MTRLPSYCNKNKVICSFRGHAYCIAINHRNRMIISGLENMHWVDNLCENSAVTSAGGSDGRLLFFHLSSKEPIMSFDAHSETGLSMSWNLSVDDFC